MRLGVTGQPVAAAGQRALVAVEPDERQLGVRGEQGLRVATETEGGVDGHRGPVGQRWRQQGEHAIEQHRHVRRRGAAAVSSSSVLMRVAPGSLVRVAGGDRPCV